MRKNHRMRSHKVVSYNMSMIRSSGSRIERVLGSSMHYTGLRYRKQYRVEGRPDFAFPKEKTAVFCDSSFWHGRNWQRGAKQLIKTNRRFWWKKIERNIQRDKEVNGILEKEGWVVLRFWDDDIIGNPRKCAEVVARAVARRRTTGL